MPSGARDAILKARSALHRSIFSATKGRVLGRWGGHPVVMLTTIGRRTGRRRITMLASPLQDGDRIILVASNGGAARHPDWFLNLRDRPEVDVLMAGRRERMHARVATPEEEEGLWPRVTSRSPSYGRYRDRTTRRIPIVLLEPATARSDP
jgi:deazaflavin-dependent oxidoreductase (nitroreductase family)